MPLKLNVGISKKIGLPDFGSLGATCHLELELESGLVFADPEAFQQRVRHAYAACRDAVAEELARQTTTLAPVTSAVGLTVNGHNGTHQTNGNGAPHRASVKQLDYAKQLASQIRDLGVRRLEGLAAKMFGRPFADLTTLDASGLIDVLKAIKDGKLELATALDGVN